MLALLEEAVGTVAVAKIEVLPRLAPGSGPVLNSFAIDEDLDCADIPGEVTGVAMDLPRFGGRSGSRFAHLRRGVTEGAQPCSEKEVAARDFMRPVEGSQRRSNSAGESWLRPE